MPLPLGPLNVIVRLARSTASTTATVCAMLWAACFSDPVAAGLLLVAPWCCARRAGVVPTISAPAASVIAVFMICSPTLPDHVVRTHHFVLFVLQDMAVENISERISWIGVRCRRRQVVPRDEADDLPGQGDHGVLPRRPFVRTCRDRGPGEDDLVHPGILCERVGVERPPVENLELHKMDVNRMRVPGRVDEAPFLDRSRLRVLGDRIIPVQTDALLELLRIGNSGDVGLDRRLGVRRVVLAEHEMPRPDRRILAWIKEPGVELPGHLAVIEPA